MIPAIIRKTNKLAGGYCGLARFGVFCVFPPNHSIQPAYLRKMRWANTARNAMYPPRCWSIIHFDPPSCLILSFLEMVVRKNQMPIVKSPVAVAGHSLRKKGIVNRWGMKNSEITAWISPVRKARMPRERLYTKAFPNCGSIRLTGPMRSVMPATIAAVDPNALLAIPRL